MLQFLPLIAGMMGESQSGPQSQFAGMPAPAATGGQQFTNPMSGQQGAIGDIFRLYQALQTMPPQQSIR